jgi:hypothetical protein
LRRAFLLGDDPDVAADAEAAAAPSARSSRASAKPHRSRDRHRKAGSPLNDAPDDDGEDDNDDGDCPAVSTPSAAVDAAAAAAEEEGDEDPRRPAPDRRQALMKTKSASWGEHAPSFPTQARAKAPDPRPL